MLPIGSPVDLRTMHQSMLPLSYWRTHDPMILLVCITSLWGSQVANLVTSGSDIQFLKHASASDSSNLLSSRRSVLMFRVLSVTVSPPAATP